MHDTPRLIAALKRQLRAREITYADVAVALEMAESSVKRLLASGHLTLERLDTICALAGTSIVELARGLDSDASRVKQLSRAQESELVADTGLLLVAACVINHIPAEAITQRYQIEDAELVRHLTHLDRLGLIELQPGNRVRLRVARDFDWLPDGPIAQFFVAELRADFLNPRNRGQRSDVFLHGMLTEDARRELDALIKRLRDEFARLHDACRRAPLNARTGQALFLASGNWEPVSFAARRRT